MPWRLRQFIALAEVSLLETLRQTVFLLVSTCAFLFIALLPVVIMNTLGESERLVRDNGLAVHFLFGVVLGSYAATASLSHELSRGTGALILSKPVDRALFFLAKFAGAALALLLFSLGAGLTTILASRTASGFFELDCWAGVPLWTAPVLAFALGGTLNFLTGRPFGSRTFVWMLVLLAGAFVFAGFVDPDGHLCRFGAHLDWRIVPASLLISIALLVLTGLAALLATRLESVPALIICTVVFLLGLMSDYLFGRAAGHSRAAAALYHLVPNWQHFWMADALAGDGHIPWTYVGHAALYGLTYLSGLLVLGMLVFQRTEVKA